MIGDHPAGPLLSCATRGADAPRLASRRELGMAEGSDDKPATNCRPSSPIVPAGFRLSANPLRLLMCHRPPPAALALRAPERDSCRVDRSLPRNGSSCSRGTMRTGTSGSAAAVKSVTAPITVASCAYPVTVTASSRMSHRVDPVRRVVSRQEKGATLNRRGRRSG